MNYAEHYRRLYAVGGPDAVRAQMVADINEEIDYGDGPTISIEAIVKAASEYNV